MSVAIPSRASDAGPEQSEPLDWRDWLYEAEDAIRTARTLSRSDAAVAQKLWREAIEDARESISRALEMLL